MPPDGEAAEAPKEVKGNEAAQAQIPDKVRELCVIIRAAAARPPPHDTPMQTACCIRQAGLVCSSWGCHTACKWTVAVRHLTHTGSQPDMPLVACASARSGLNQQASRSHAAGASGRQPHVHSGQEAGQGRLRPGVHGAAGAADQGERRRQCQPGALRSLQASSSWVSGLPAACMCFNCWSSWVQHRQHMSTQCCPLLLLHLSYR